jgi:hypothetical protein
VAERFIPKIVIHVPDARPVWKLAPFTTPPGDEMTGPVGALTVNERGGNVV